MLGSPRPTVPQVKAAATAVRHELNEVEALTDYSERGAKEICEAVVRTVLEAIISPVARNGELCDCETPGDWHRVANDFQRAMFDERARAIRITANLRTAEEELKDIQQAYMQEVALADQRAGEAT